MRAEERDLVGDLAGEAHESLLIGDREAVARLDLERRRALGVQLGHEPGEPRAQLVVGRGTSGRDGRADAAGLVAPAGHARGELLGAIAAEHEVRVAVDEPGDHRPAAASTTSTSASQMPRRSSPSRWSSRSSCRARCSLAWWLADPRDTSALDEHGGVAHDAERSALAVGRRVVRHELADAREQHPSRGRAVAHPSSIGTRSPRSRATSMARS